MLIRIVKLTFKPENIASFERIFEESKNGILAFDGCNMVELYRDIDNPNIFFTYSFWEGESSLERYRRSEEHTSELQSRENLVCRLLIEKKKSTKCDY